MLLTKEFVVHSARSVRRRQSNKITVALHPLRLELLEKRTLLSSGAVSAVTTPVYHYDYILYNHTTNTPVLPAQNLKSNTYNPATTSVLPAENFASYAASQIAPLDSSSPYGFTPSQIRTAYGISSIALGSVVGNGAGQTIAIIDAYDDPAFVDSTSSNFDGSDLHTFDKTFGLPDPPSFEKLDEYGGTNYPSPDTTGWSTEMALDVEWSHAIAPQANIILYEANSASFADLDTAVISATNNPAVTVISMSWGASEFSGETSYDSVFTTPANRLAAHNGVTFVASTGDSGAPGEYPAYSPNIVAAGGTTLTIDPSTSAYVSESGWTDGGGGESSYEPEPTYQDGVQHSGFRGIPDVSFDADPATGVAICDSYQAGHPTGSGPWLEIGGTSVASPCWAGLIAVGDQLRASVGLTPMDGRSQTLPLLYSMPAADFYDITTGNNGNAAGVGYDMVTGIGSPVANNLVPDFAVPGPRSRDLLGEFLSGRRPGEHHGPRWQRHDVSGDGDLECRRQRDTHAGGARQWHLHGVDRHVGRRSDAGRRRVGSRARWASHRLLQRHERRRPDLRFLRRGDDVSPRFRVTTPTALPAASAIFPIARR